MTENKKWAIVFFGDVIMGLQASVPIMFACLIFVSQYSGLANIVMFVACLVVLLFSLLSALLPGHMRIGGGVGESNAVISVAVFASVWVGLSLLWVAMILL